MDMPTLEINNISKKYGKFKALDNVSLSIPPGIFGLLGPNGAGKSTLMRILTTIHSYDSGSIQYNEVDWKQKVRVQRLIGYLPQKFSLYKHLTITDCLKHIATLKGIRKDQSEQVQSVLEQVNLLDVKDRKIGKLSGGMVRRVGIAQAIIGHPRIIVVDEPTAGLDPEERIRFRNILHRIGRENTIIISSHIVEDIETLCSEAAILYRGKILAKGDIKTLRKSVDHLIWSARVEGHELSRLQDKVKIIRQQSMGDYYNVRYLSEVGKASDQDQPEEPTLEDAYFYYMQRVDRLQ